MTTDDTPSQPTALDQGICLNPEAIRTELEEAPESLEVTPQQAAALAALPDSVIANAIDRSVGDDFWAAFDEARRTAINMLISELDAGEES